MEPIAADERERAVATIVAAFEHDPVERWMFPELDSYRRDFAEFVRAFGGAAFEHGTAWELDDFGAVSLWLPPSAHADEEAIGRVFAERVAEDKQADLWAVAAQMGDAHPGYPHWYLPWLAVAPGRQGAGLGGTLLREALANVDADRLPAYLETPNPRTVPFYERHGFAVTGQAVAGSCPPITTMLRPAVAG